MIHHRGNEGDRLRVPWPLPWCPWSPSRTRKCLGALALPKTNHYTGLPFHLSAISPYPYQICVSASVEGKGKFGFLIWLAPLSHPLLVHYPSWTICNELLTPSACAPIVCFICLFLLFNPVSTACTGCTPLRFIKKYTKKVALDWLSLFWGRVRVECLWSHIRLCLRQNKLLLLGLPKILWANLLFIPSFKS